MRDDEDLRWQSQGACLGADPDLFFPERGGSSAVAKLTCRRCPVRPECLEWALSTNEKFGIWGGLSERQRRRLKRRREEERRSA